MQQFCTYGSVRGCVKNVLRHDAVSKMKGGPSEPACRSGLQTAVSCWSRKATGGERYGKGAALTASGEGERDERKRTADEPSKQIYWWHQNRGAPCAAPLG